MKKIFYFIILALVLIFPAVVSAGYYYAAPAAAANGQIGNITHDHAPSTASSGYTYHDGFTPTTTGPVNYAHIYIDDNNGVTCCLSIYAANGTELASVTWVGALTDPGWDDQQLDGEVTLEAATTYYLGFAKDGNNVQLYQKEAGDDDFYDTQAYSCGQPLNPEESTWGSNHDLTIWFDNVAGSPE